MNKYEESLMSMCTRCEHFGRDCANIFRGYKCGDYDDLQELVEKSKEVKPKEGHIKPFHNFCPICGCLVFDSQNYCHRCGQKLDWSDEE